MKPVAPIDFKSISASTMTSSTNKNNNKKDKTKSPGGTSNAPGGGTSNAGNNSPADSPFSDGEFVSPIIQDVKPVIKQPVDESPSGDFDTFEQLAALMKTIPTHGQENLMRAYAKHAGFTLSKNTPPTTTRQFSYTEAYKHASHQDQDMSPGMFDGRETPMTTGFTPNVENFSQRRVPSYGGTTASFTLPPNGSQPSTTVGINSAGFNYFVPPVGTSYTVPPPPSPAYEQPNANPRTTVPPQFANPRTTEPSQFNQTYYVHPTGTTTTMPSQPTTQYYAPPTQPARNPPNTVPQQHPAPPPWAPHASTPGPSFPTGLALRANPRPDEFVNYENNRIIVPRDKRGNTDKDKVKMHEVCTEGITPPITRGNIAKLLTSTDASYGIASDAAQWQAALSNIWDHVVRFDYSHIVFIPTSFDSANPNSFGNNSTFINAVLDHDQLTDNHYFSWQTLIRRFGQREELQSDGWLKDKLKNSLDPGLKAEVMSDFNELPSTQ